MQKRGISLTPLMNIYIYLFKYIYKAIDNQQPPTSNDKKKLYALHLHIKSHIFC